MSVEIFYDKVLTIYRGLDTDQRRILKERIVKEDGDATVSFTKSAPAKKRGGWKSYKPYWMKSFEAFDASKKGTECVVGEYFMEVKDQVSDGGYFVVGCRAEPKVYYLARRGHGDTSFDDGDGNTFELKDALIVVRCESWKEIRAKLKDVY